MDKAVLIGLIIFIIAEVLCVVALFSSDWLVSDHLGKATYHLWLNHGSMSTLPS